MIEVIHSNPELRIKCWKCSEPMKACRDRNYSDELIFDLNCPDCESTAILKIPKDYYSYNS